MDNQQQSVSNEEFLAQVALVGDSGVGKTNIMWRFAKQSEYTPTNITTIGVETMNKVLDIDGTSIQMNIWDTAGQERFKTLAPTYFRQSKGVMIIYSITDKLSFENVKDWLSQIELYTDPQKCCQMIVANKIDLKDDRQVTYNQGEELAQKYDLPFFEVSAYTSQNIDEIFLTMGKNLQDMLGKAEKVKRLTDVEDPKPKPGCC